MRQDGLLVELIPQPETIVLGGRVLTLEECPSGGWIAFDADDPEFPDSELADRPIARKMDLLRLGWRLAVHNAIQVNVSQVDDRVLFLGETTPAIGVSLGLFTAPDSAIAALTSLPTRYTSRLRGHLVICPSLRFTPAMERELEQLHVIPVRVADDELNLDPRIDVALSRLAPPSDVAGYDRSSGLRWAIGFNTVVRRGLRYDFATQAAAVVEVLFEAWTNGTPFLHQRHLLERAGSAGQELRDLFRDHPAWGSFIVSGPTRGTFGLDP